MKTLSVIIPVYNEESCIGPVVDEIHAVLGELNLEYELIAVNDGSTDGSQDILENKKVRLLRHQSNRGYGASLKEGIKAARFERILITDADGTYPVKAIPSLLREADKSVPNSFNTRLKALKVKTFLSFSETSGIFLFLFS